MLAGKVVIDCNNTVLDDDARPIGVDPSGPTLAERLAADIPAASVVKAFSSIPHRVIELDRETLLPTAFQIAGMGLGPFATLSLNIVGR